MGSSPSEARPPRSGAFSASRAALVSVHNIARPFSDQYKKRQPTTDELPQVAGALLFYQHPPKLTISVYLATRMTRSSFVKGAQVERLRFQYQFAARSISVSSRYQTLLLVRSSELPSLSFFVQRLSRCRSRRLGRRICALGASVLPESPGVN